MCRQVPSRRPHLLAAAVWLCGLVAADARAVTVRPIPMPVDAPAVWAAVSEPVAAVDVVGGRGGARRRTTIAEAAQRLAEINAQAALLPSIAEQAAAMLQRTGMSFDDIELDTGVLDDSDRSEDDVSTTDNRSDVVPDEQAIDGQPESFDNVDSDSQFELRLANTSMRQLHRHAQESIVEFLLLVQACLDRGELIAAKVSSIVERFRLDTSDGQHARRQHVVVLKLQAKVLNSGRGARLSTAQMAGELESLLADRSCDLFQSDFAFAMEHASVQVQPPTVQHAPRPPSTLTQTQAMAAMALPVAVSTAFTGLLLWVAAG